MGWDLGKGGGCPARPPQSHPPGIAFWNKTALILNGAAGNLKSLLLHCYTGAWGQVCGHHPGPRGGQSKGKFTPPKKTTHVLLPWPPEQLPKGSVKVQRDAQGAAERGAPQLCRESFGRGFFWGGGTPQYPPGTSHGTGPQAPLQLLGAGSGPADPWFHSINQICCSGKFDLFLGPDTFQTLLLFIFYFFSF